MNPIRPVGQLFRSACGLATSAFGNNKTTTFGSTITVAAAVSSVATLIFKSREAQLLRFALAMGSLVVGGLTWLYHHSYKVLTQDNQSLHGQIQKLQQTIDASQTELGNAKANIGAFNRDKIARDRGEIQILQQNLDTLRTDLAAVQQQKEASEKKLEETIGELDKLKGRLETVSAEKTSLEERVRAANDLHEEDLQDKAKLSAETEELMSNLYDATQEIERLLAIPAKTQDSSELQSLQSPAPEQKAKNTNPNSAKKLLSIRRVPQTPDKADGGSRSPASPPPSPSLSATDVKRSSETAVKLEENFQSTEKKSNNESCLPETPPPPPTSPNLSPSEFKPSPETTAGSNGDDSDSTRSATSPEISEKK